MECAISAQWNGNPEIEDCLLRNGYTDLESQCCLQIQVAEESDSWRGLEERLSVGKIDELAISNTDLAIGRDTISLRLAAQSKDRPSTLPLSARILYLAD